MTTCVDGKRVEFAPYYHNSIDLCEEPKWVAVDGGMLFSRCFGDKGSAVIIIDGGPGLPHDYLLELSALSAQNRVIFFDPRGCGKSTGEIDDSKMNMKTFIEDLEALRRAYNLEKVSFIGHSSGGPMLMRYAIEHPECVDKMIFLNSMDAFYIHDPKPKQDYIAGIRAIKASSGFKNDQREEIISSYKAFFKPAFYKAENVDKLNLEMSLEAAKNSVLVREAFERTLFEPSFDYQKELSELLIPALIIHSVNDFIPRSVAENLQRVLRKSEEPIDIKDCGHFSVTEQPDIVCQHISAFLQSK